jgi:hypothetical protein
MFNCPAQPSTELISCLRKQDAYKIFGVDIAIPVSYTVAENVLKLRTVKKRLLT